MYRIIAAIIIIGVSGISSWLLKRRLKGEMESKLGRKVNDSELTSISAWMKPPSQPPSEPNHEN
jgi:hypothetical protein